MQRWRWAWSYCCSNHGKGAKINAKTCMFSHWIVLASRGFSYSNLKHWFICIGTISKMYVVNNLSCSNLHALLLPCQVSSLPASSPNHGAFAVDLVVAAIVLGQGRSVGYQRPSKAPSPPSFGSSRRFLCLPRWVVAWSSLPHGSADAPFVSNLSQAALLFYVYVCVLM